jgi:hypothetical protein
MVAMSLPYPAGLETQPLQIFPDILQIFTLAIESYSSFT